MTIKTLSNGEKMPQVGLGVYKMTDKEEAINAITTALEVGYRAIDTATLYDNESIVGEAIKASNIPREDIFITTKVWNTDQGYDETLRAFEKSLELLQLDYLDSYLTHWPVPGKFTETYRAIERLYEEKLIRVPGVSNHHEQHLRALEKNSNIKPVINQIECHPLLQQNELIAFCKERDISVTAWGPLGRGRVLPDEALTEIGEKHNKTAAQVILRWHLERDTIIIPKSVTPSRIKENFEVFDFSLDQADMRKLAEYDCNGRTGANSSEPDFMRHFEGM